MGIQGAEALLGHRRQFALFAPGIHAVVFQESRHVSERESAQPARDAVESRMTENEAGQLHRPAFGPGQLPARVDFPPPGE